MTQSKIAKVNLSRPRIEPEVKHVSFRQFAGELIPELMGKFPSLEFTDGYCFGQLEYIDLESGIDTSMGGGDSNYHFREIRPADAIVLTPNGFRVDDKVQFVFVLPNASPVKFQTLGELADYQAAHRMHMLADSDMSQKLPGNGMGDTPRIFAKIQGIHEKVNGEILCGSFVAYETVETERKFLPANHPVKVLENGSIEIKGLEDSQFYSGDEYTLMIPPENIWKA